ncbi:MULTISPECIES: phosphatase PAP2 family protein [unclassified Bradyrhizobium]|uniref:phosphatase PAP2 family protein n=1 Tax=unclassified Bradyrhizobium TaxID=2631580 RepID=UPI002916373D|nr:MULTISPECIES: phosphatase PAP2 family protein [unclassified Bradyrhizobium]
MNSDEAGLAWRTFNLNWIPVAILGAVLFCVTLCTNFSLEPVAFGVAVAIALLLAAVAYGSALIKPDVADPKLVFWFGATAQIIVVTAIVGPLSYVANALNWPLQDQTLLVIDRAIGMDPQPIAAFFNEHSWLVKYLNVGYGFIKWPLLGIPIILTMTLRFTRLQQFVLALNLALAVTIVISVFVPAVGTYYGLGLSPAEQFPLIDSTNYAAQLRDILALRDGSLRHLELLRLSGIVSFPSFHTASAVLYMWAVWPVRAFRWATIALNTWMIAATPLIGAHYIIDVVGGAVVAAGAVLLTKHLFRSLLLGSRRRKAPLVDVNQPELRFSLK